MTTASMEISLRHWGLALLGALALHGSLAWLAALPPESGALASGIGGIQVALGPAGGAPGEASEVTPEEAAGVEDALPEATSAAPPETQQAPPEEPAEAEAVEVPAATPVAAPPPEVATATPLYAPVETVEREVMETPPPPTAKPRRASVAEKTPPQPEEVPEVIAKAAPPREDAVQEAAAPTATSAAAEGDPTEAALQGSAGKVGIGEATTAGHANGSSGGGRPGDRVDYKARLLAWLEQHKKYPRRARLRGYEGKAWLSFVIDANGKLLEYRLEEGTGHKMLDKEVVAMIERAAPLPAPPPEAARTRFVYRVPVGFNLR